MKGTMTPFLFAGTSMRFGVSNILSLSHPHVYGDYGLPWTLGVKQSGLYPFHLRCLGSLGDAE